MMKEAFILCSSIAFTGAIINMVISASGEKSISNIVCSMLAFVLVMAFLQTISGDDIPEISFDFKVEEDVQISKYVLENAIENTQTEIKKQIQSAIENRFNVSPLNIDLKINKETLKIERLIITLAQSDLFVSSYQLKEFIKSNFQIEAEVYFS